MRYEYANLEKIAAVPSSSADIIEIELREEFTKVAR